MLTKSNYISYLQCVKYLWLKKKRPELLPTEVDANLQRLFESGYEVEALAYKLFPNGVSVPEGGFREVISQTNRLMIAKTPVIFQASIASRDLFTRSDILAYDKDSDAWDLIEVKSATQVHDVHLDDLAFQKVCLEEVGLRVNRIFIIHINNQYVRQGEIEPDKLFTKAEVTDEVKVKEEETKVNIKSALQVLKSSVEPEVRVLRQCDQPYKCPFIPYCWENFPEQSVYSIASALGEEQLTELLDQGILEVKDIPEDFLTNEKLIKHHEAVKHDIVHIEKENIKEEIEKIKYPIYFLDYETFSPAIPIYDGYRPYQRIVFQYSLHVQERQDGELKHYYFLAKDSSDPTKAMAESLRKIIKSKGSLIAWFMGFEKGCNKEMGERAPEFTEFFIDLNERMYDLMHVFKEGYFVHKDFHGSASLKKVLPVVVPSLSYSDLDIHEGATASNSWGEMINPETSAQRSQKIYGDLLKYCELDTLAMVKILEALNSLVAE